MAKIFDFDARLGSYKDQVTGVYGVNSKGEFIINSKGNCWKGDQNSNANIIFSNLSQLAFGLNDFSISFSFKKLPYISIGSAWNSLFGTTAVGNSDGFSCSYNSTNRLYFHVGTAVISDTSLIEGNFYHIVITRIAGIIYMYVNNILQSSSVTVNNDISQISLKIGYEGTTTRYSNSCINNIKIYDTALSQTEITSLYKEFQNSYPTIENNYPWYEDCRPTDLSNVGGLVAAYNMIPKDGVLPDISGNGYNGDVNGGQSSVNGILFDGVNDDVKISGLDVTPTMSFNIRLCPTKFNAYIVGVRDAGLTSYMVVINSSGNITTSYYDGTFVTMIESSTSLVLNEWVSLSVVLDKDAPSNSKIYFNGVEQDTVAGADLSIPSTADSYIGSRGNQFYFEGEMSDLRIYNKVLTDQEILDYHNYWAKQVYLKEYNLDEGVGNSLPLHWNPGTGTYEVKEDSEGKYTECLTAGGISIQNTQAYGEWEFDAYKSNGTAFYDIQFISETSSGAINSSNKYSFRIYDDESITLFNKGTIRLRTAPGYISLNTWYRFKVTRATNGEFTFYIKGGNFGDDFMLIDVTGGSGTNPVIDNTYTESQYIVLDLDIGDRIRNIKLNRGIKNE